MRLKINLGWVYAILVILIVALGSWWVIFLTGEGGNYERYHLQRLETDRIRAAYLIRTVPEINEDPTARLSEEFPGLRFEETAQGTEVRVDPAARERIVREAGRRSRMFISEGIFFLFLLGVGTTIISLAYRRERAFKSARELFLAGATHAFRTPLASLRLFTETLSRPDLKEPDRIRIRASMIQDMERLESLVEQVLSLSREERLRPGTEEVFDMAAETEKTLAHLQGFLEGEGVRLETDLAGDCRVRGLVAAFSLSLHNLVQNAATYGNPPGRVVIRLQRSGKTGRLAVQDEGPGIPRRYRKKVFQGFFRSAETRGSGLGLYLVRRHMETMGGRVELNSEEGAGTTVTLVLPLYEGKSS